MTSTLAAQSAIPHLLGDDEHAAVGRILVVIPTYCEAANIETVIARVRRAVPAADILVVDDDSPDGTAARARVAGARLGRIEVLSRTEKAGLGAAYRAGFAHGLAQGYDVLIEMDADLSHDPAALPQLIDAITHGADLAIGSRYIPGAAIPGWKTSRRALSRWGNRYAAFVLGLDTADLTSGYRAFTADSLRAADYTSTEATGYAFQIELAQRVAGAHGVIREVPIVFHDRADGESKMSSRIAVEALVLVTWWGLRDRWQRRVGRGA